MSQTAPSAHASDSVNLQRLDARRAAILAGDVYPSRHDRLIGMPPYRDSPAADLRYLAETEIARGVFPAVILSSMASMAVAPSRYTATALRAALHDVPTSTGFHFNAIVDALDFNLALLGDACARQRVIEDAASYNHATLQRADPIYFALGLAETHATQEEREYEPGDHAELMRAGQRIFERAAETSQRVSLARLAMLAREVGVDSIVDLMLEDRAEMVADPGPRSLVPRTSGLLVVPALPTGTGSKKEMYKTWEGKAGRPLPLVGRGDVGSHRRSLVAQWPHAADVIDVILGDLAARDPVHFRPTLLVRSPGSGKSSLCRAIGDRVGVEVELIGLGGSSDSSLMGTSAQWYTARESVPLQLVKRSGKANPLLIWDEVEKASPSRHNGSALDALLALLEPDQARAYRDPALEVECDLSMVSHFATANSLEGVPAPLRDRMRVVTMPEPGWQHVSVLITQIVARIARERGVDPRWFAPLAEDELDLVKGAWPGGSLRQLTRVVTVIVDGRDRIIGRA